MRFEQALQLMRQGKKVRRTAWTGWDGFLALRGGWIYEEALRPGIGLPFNYVYTADLLAEDWEVVL